MLTRREFLGQSAKALAGGAVVASGILKIVPNDSNPLPKVVPSKDKYDIVIYGPALARANFGLPQDLTKVYFEGSLIRAFSREELIAKGVDWEPQAGDICFFGVFVD